MYPISFGLMLYIVKKKLIYKGFSFPRSARVTIMNDKMDKMSVVKKINAGNEFM
jgi:hypothetical protein